MLAVLPQLHTMSALIITLHSHSCLLSSLVSGNVNHNVWVKACAESLGMYLTFELQHTRSMLTSAKRLSPQCNKLA